MSSRRQNEVIVTVERSVIPFPSRASRFLLDTFDPASPGRLVKPMRAASDHQAPGGDGPGVQTAKSIISMLQQAVEAAKRNEEQTKVQAQQWYEKAHAAEAHIRAMEAEMKQLERRTRVAEEELQKIENAIQSILMEPLLARNQVGAA